MAYRIERIIPGDFRDYLMHLWEGTDLPSFVGSTSKAYLFDDKDVADAVVQRLAAKCSQTMETPHLKSQPIAYEVVEVSKHAWGRFAVYSYDKWQEQFPDAVPAGRYDKLDDAKKHAESVTYKMVVVDSKAESRSFIYTNWSDGITPKQCGASQLACNIVNETFLSLDGFASMRRQMSDTTYTAEQFAGELARIVDREIGKLAPPPVFRITAIRRTSVFGSCSLFATFDGGEERLLFSYYLDELAFSDDELIGLTEDEAHQLRQQKDVAYLRT